jgi:hypothetical protein
MNIFFNLILRHILLEYLLFLNRTKYNTGRKEWEGVGEGRKGVGILSQQDPNDT